MLFQSKNFRQILFQSIRRYYQQQSQNIVDNFVENRTPSIIWNSDVLHGLTGEQIEFRQMVRNFAEKELPEELVQKVSGKFSFIQI